MQQIAAVLNNIMNIYVSSIKSSWEKVCLDCFVKKSWHGSIGNNQTELLLPSCRIASVF